MKAELRWAWHTAAASKSFNCENKTSDLLSSMFVDSQIAKSFSCGRQKLTYLVNFAIAPFAQESILDDMKDVAFDESDGKMMIVVRYNNGEGSIHTEMLDFVTIGSDFSAEVCADLIHSNIVNKGLLAIEKAALQSAQLKRKSYSLASAALPKIPKKH